MTSENEKNDSVRPDNEIKKDVNNENSKLANTDFMRERFKQRPISKKKLLRRTIITVSMAVIFGIVACVTFLLLQPVINNGLYPENEPEPVTFPEETESDEMTPEDMYIDDDEIAKEAAAEAAAQAVEEASNIAQTNLEQMEGIIEAYKFSVSDFNEINTSMKDLAKECSKSIVTVTGVSSDYNWVNNTYESSDNSSGLIVADNGSELMILTQADNIEGAEEISVTFPDSSVYAANLKLKDSVTGLCIIAVEDSDISEVTMQSTKVAELGSSNSGNLTGSAVIAIGQPVGVTGSVAYGYITSEKTSLDLVDSNYKLLTTDIYGSSNGNGVIVNLSGQVIGFIDMNYNSDEQSNRVCALGITELKNLIEHLSNKIGKSYLGIHGATVPVDVQEIQGVPAGVYISKTEVDSPAMLAGVQSGDIIVALDGSEIPSYEVFVSKLDEVTPGDTVTLSVKRAA
ncbi:MAG: S1C family serine protease, partial [Butyrivibrio sp.]|nr:S1C family serine protease [Butyrivibrio sp.]